MLNYEPTKIAPTALERAIDSLRLTDTTAQANRAMSLTAFKERTWVDNAKYERSPHLDALDHLLERCFRFVQTKGKDGIPLLQVSMPPRYGKTATLKYFVAWVNGINPNLRTIYVSYAASLARKSGRGVRDLLDTPRYKNLFTTTVVDPRSSAQDSWDLYKKPGGMDSRGIFAGITGLGADILIIDDLIEGEDEAQSAHMRQKIYDELQASVFTRRQGRHAVTIMVGTRWHLDDPIGKVLLNQEGQWFQFNLPALIDETQQVHDDKGELIFERQPDEPLHERVHTLAELRKMEREMPAAMWQALYQQDPILASGGMFKREWFYPTVTETPEIDSEVRYWDLAMTDNPTSDFTVGVRIARCVDGHHYVTDVKRFKKDWGEVGAEIGKTALADGTDVIIGVEKAAGGSRAVKDLNADPRMHGYTVKGYDVTRKKHIRAAPLVGHLQTGMLHLLKAGWNDAFVDEFVAFNPDPKKNKYDDQVDAASGAWEMLDEFGVGMGWTSWAGW